MQEACGGFNNCNYMIESRGCLAMNFITFMKMASQDLFRGAEENFFFFKSAVH